MQTVKVTTRLSGMDELNEAMNQAKKAADNLDKAVAAVRNAVYSVGLIVEQPPADAEG